MDKKEKKCAAHLLAFSFANIQNTVTLLEAVKACDENVKTIEDVLDMIRSISPAAFVSPGHAKIKQITKSNSICPSCGAYMEAKAVNICSSTIIDDCSDCKTWIHCAHCHYELYSKKPIMMFRR